MSIKINQGTKNENVYIMYRIKKGITTYIVYVKTNIY